MKRSARPLRVRTLSEDAYQAVTLRRQRTDSVSPFSRMRRAGPPGALRQQPAIPRELLERYLGAGADVRDHLGRRERTKSCRFLMPRTAREPEQEAGGEEVAGAGGVDHPRYRE